MRSARSSRTKKVVDAAGSACSAGTGSATSGLAQIPEMEVSAAAAAGAVLRPSSQCHLNGPAL